jgi:hypothetical protein
MHGYASKAATKNLQTGVNDIDLKPTGRSKAAIKICVKLVFLVKIKPSRFGL